MRSFPATPVPGLLALAASLGLLATSERAGATGDGVGKPMFEKDIRPILKTHCFQCHGEEDETRGGLDVRLRRFLEKGGESGPAIIPGEAAESHLLELLKSGEMPKKKARLSDSQIATIEHWIDNGAPTARPEPEKLEPGPRFTEEEKAWWSFQPVTRPDPPDLAGTKRPDGNTIDTFVARKLAENHLGFSGSASPLTLVRRVAFDLTGLPPSPEEIDAFVEASGRDPESAYASLVDRLLASPSYGERWGRHWLDVAGYADSDGHDARDLDRGHAWKFRDYVIDSLNGDKPFDVFVREQLAGDEIAALEGLNPDSPTRVERARYAELLIATGFLRMAPDGTGVKDDTASRNACITDTIKIIGTSLYGLTIGCAECHDHRYDAISQADYYRLRAVFEPGFDPANWRAPKGRLVSLQTAEDAAQSALIEVEAKQIDDARSKKQEQFVSQVLEKELAERDESIRDALRTAYRTEAGKRTPEQSELLTANPSVKSLSGGSLYLYDTTYKTKNAAELKEMASEAAEVRKKKPVHQYAHAFAELASETGAVPVTHVFQRGDPDSPGEEVEPGDLTVLGGWREVAVPPDSDAVPTTGRRLAFARSLTDGGHPLLARVIVNRVWMHHFGRGLVTTAGDFGVLGDPPSHPELLDWLASEFMDQGWSLKRLHRLIVSSHSYRQESKRDPERERIDPDNRLLSRQNVRRLEAETLRDALLAASGKLNPRVHGKPVPVMFDEEGQVVIGNDTTDSSGRPTGKFISLDGEEFRRSIYVQIRRTRPLEMFSAFDAPSMMDPNCEVRPVTTVSPQCLLLMNNSGMRVHARHFAERIQAEGDPDLAHQVDRAWRLAYGSKPGDDDLGAAVGYVKAQTGYYRANPTRFETVAGPAEQENSPPELLGLAALCQALMSANAFLYID